MPLLPYLLPFVLFMAGTMVETKGWLGLGYEPWYLFKTLAVAASLLYYRKRYPAFSKAGFGLALLAGVAGCVVWVLLARLQAAIPAIQAALDFVQQGGRATYNPLEGEGLTPGRIAFIAVRLIGLAVVVPLMEEFFWRGFLARYLISENFESVPQGKLTPFSFAVVTLAFAAVHPEILAALAWGAVINVLYRKSANLWACVVMHAVTNALLGGYVLATGAWELW